MRVPSLLAAIVAALLTGCSGPEGQVVRRWTLRTADSTRSVELPVHLELPKRVAHYRLEAAVVLQESLRDQDVDLAIAHLPAQVTLRVDGIVIPPTQSVEGSEATHRHIGPHRWAIPSGAVRGGRLSLELEVSHGWTQSAWLDVPPRIVPSAAVTGEMHLNRILNAHGGWFGLVALSQMGLTFLAVFFWNRRRRAYLWFAIQALTASYYPAYVLGLTTWLGAKLEPLLLAQSLCVATITSVYYTHDFFGRGKPHRGWLALMLVSMAVPLPALFSEFVDSSYGTPGVVACVAATIVYQVATGTRLVASYADRRIGIFFLCCWLALGGSAWIDLVAWIGGGEVLAGGRPACIGLGLFGIFQSMLLSRSHFRSLEESDQLNSTLSRRLRELEERQAEIEVLNEELRQQVGRRSAHILAALTHSEIASASVRFEPGDVVEDRYRVIAALGAGGMGTVYEVERVHDGRRLALKVALETRSLALARLAREAQIATRVRHPNLVAVVDTDVAKAGYVYLVMELVEGCSLGDCEGRHDVPWCLEVLVQILEGLRALHAQGIVHRDLKPPNVLLSGDLERGPHVKITDFGISRGPAESDEIPLSSARVPDEPAPATVRVSMRSAAARESTDSKHPVDDANTAQDLASGTPQLTRPGAISGTPLYVAPELARPGSQITPAVDVFSFGVVAYRLLTGTPPHREAPLLARLDRRDPLPHEPLAMASLPPKIARMLDACLSFTPNDRPETGAILSVLQDALEVTAPELQRERVR